ILLQPFLTHAPKEMFAQLGVETEAAKDWTAVQFGHFPADAKVVAKGTPIFPRLDIEAEVAYIKKQMDGGASTLSEEEEIPAEWDPTETKLVSVKEKQIKYEDFDKVELKVAEVIDCGKVE